MIIQSVRTRIESHYLPFLHGARMAKDLCQLNTMLGFLFLRLIVDVQNFSSFQCQEEKTLLSGLFKHTSYRNADWSFFSSTECSNCSNVPETCAALGISCFKHIAEIVSYTSVCERRRLVVKECVCCPLSEENERTAYSRTISSWRRGDGLPDGGRGNLCVCRKRGRDSGRSWKMCNHIPMNKSSSQKNPPH